MAKLNPNPNPITLSLSLSLTLALALALTLTLPPTPSLTLDQAPEVLLASFATSALLVDDAEGGGAAGAPSGF